MRSRPSFKLPHLIGPLLLLAAGLAHAQYSWIDEKGIRQLSDRPPPPGTPASKILKAPGKLPTPVAEARNDTADPRPLPEREAAFIGELKKMSAKEAKASTTLARAQEHDCTRAHKYKDWVESGAPVFAKGEDGKQRPMTPQERAGEIKLAETFLQRCP